MKNFVLDGRYEELLTHYNLNVEDFGIANSGIISQWLQAFDKQGINGLFPKPKGRPTMKPKYPKMPPPPKPKKNACVIAFRIGNRGGFTKKVAGTQPRKNAEKANVVKVFKVKWVRLRIICWDAISKPPSPMRNGLLISRNLNVRKTSSIYRQSRICSMVKLSPMI